MLGTVLWFNWIPGVSCEVGYWLHPDARGRGLATRATALMLDHVFATLGVQLVTAGAAADNTASRSVLERLGFRLIGLPRYAAQVRAGYVDGAIYDLTASEWAAGRSTANATASTANPASDSAAPSTSGDR
jgi:RimJ/RimL family protein N-acetyltransferase